MSQDGASPNSNPITPAPLRHQEANISKEIRENFYNLFTWLFAIIALKNTGTGTTFFAANYSLLMAIVFIKVFHHLILVLATIIQMHSKGFLPIIVIDLLLESVASVLALSLISVSIASITLALWLCIFALFCYYNHQKLYQLIPERIKKWIEKDNSEEPPLPEVTEATGSEV